jgi:predicted nucleic acid-binding protein
MRFPPLFDTCVFIGGYQDSVKAFPNYYVAAVVIQELLVGKNRDSQQRLLAGAEELAARRRLLTPTKDDWFAVGQCLGKLLRLNRGTVGGLTKDAVNLLVRDCLIARCAMLVNAMVVTINTQDFGGIKTVWPRLQYTTPDSFFLTRPR